MTKSIDPVYRLCTCGNEEIRHSEPSKHGYGCPIWMQHRIDELENKIREMETSTDKVEPVREDDEMEYLTPVEIMKAAIEVAVQTFEITTAVRVEFADFGWDLDVDSEGEMSPYVASCRIVYEED